MAKISVLGCGMVGRAIADDLSARHQLTVADKNKASFEFLRNKNITHSVIDLSHKEAIEEVIKDADLVIGAVPGFMGYETLKTVIDAGKNIVDISFFDEDPQDLIKRAQEKNVIAIMDCGVAPGMSNILLGFHNADMKVKSFECLVGGLPKIRTYPFEYKAPFSPIDVIEEYTRPARFVKDGKLVVKEALSDPELIHFKKVGTLEAFNSDGLRSIIKSFPNIPNMIERTLRYPGHISIMKILRESGFFSKEKIEINGQAIAPLDLSSKLLFKEWKLGAHEEEFTVMRIKICGEKDGKEKTYSYELYDEYNPRTETSSMARTTGYTCSAAAELILNKMITISSLYFPEMIAKNRENLEFILHYFNERNIHYNLTET